MTQILAWADDYKARHARWPQRLSGLIEGVPGETWLAVDSALRRGTRGLPPGSSLPRLLRAHRPACVEDLVDERQNAEDPGISRKSRPPDLEIEQILAWADAHHALTEQWPRARSGFIAAAPGEKWSGVDRALREGRRGMNPGSSLARLLAQRRGVRNLQGLPPYTDALILAWADAHRARTGVWPTDKAGPIPEAPGETWGAVGAALTIGTRGLPGGSSLSCLLAKQRGVRNPADLPPLDEAEILAWADAHHARTGRWPNRESGPIREAPGEKWAAIDGALRAAARGLSGPSTLSLLLHEQRGAPRWLSRPDLTAEQIVAWAEAHRARTGRWPSAESGPVAEAPGESWRGLQHALRTGRRGLPGGSSVSVLLAAHRRLPRRNTGPLSEEGILAWADAHHARTGCWPTRESGPIREAPGEKWDAVDQDLRVGLRGLPPGSSLARLLAAHRGVRNNLALPRLTEAQILAWADAHRARACRWPTAASGTILEALDETWQAVDIALRQGCRGLPGGSSLAKLLVARRQARIQPYAPTLTEARILAWADAHHRRTGRWPVQKSGPIAEAPDEKWGAVDDALRRGARGLPGGSSLARLLDAERSRRNHLALPPLTIPQILAWADAYQAHTGDWPCGSYGPIDGAPGETWRGVDRALKAGCRGHSGGSSLARLLAEHRGARNGAARPPLSAPQILVWADAHRARHGRWPQVRSGPIPEAPGETWAGVEAALRQGHRGLPGGSSLAKLLDTKRQPKPNPLTSSKGDRT